MYVYLERTIYDETTTRICNQPMRSQSGCVIYQARTLHAGGTLSHLFSNTSDGFLSLHFTSYITPTATDQTTPIFNI